MGTSSKRGSGFRARRKSNDRCGHGVHSYPAVEALEPRRMLSRQGTVDFYPPPDFYMGEGVFSDGEGTLLATGPNHVTIGESEGNDTAGTADPTGLGIGQGLSERVRLVGR
jgi:hypothetical protein